ncbi:glycosyltransferase family 2 protein [Patescibacteria group bacterium]|nr:glycosyltransferase family 2 protein [Patescibacteria group bacterium]
MAINFKNFILPTRATKSFFDVEKTSVCAIIPTYKPGELTVTLVEDLIRWNPRLAVYVVDDCTPRDEKDPFQIFEKIARVSSRITLLRTPANALKAGALNYALKYIFEGKKEYMPDVILTLDDDVVVSPTTVQNLVAELMSDNNLGAVCSQCAVLNKDKNLLTRLQGLEYLGFNATRLADEGFYGGPLVMHGMLTAFRARALFGAGGFAEKHLIEDYEITARLKTRGWRVKAAINAYAWTKVPERFSVLWRQRTRWSYGGITVIAKAKRAAPVLQDLLGHGVFFSTVLMIDLLIVLTLFGGGAAHPQLARWIIGLSLLQVAVWYLFQLWLMRFYKEKDRYDWVLRASMVPEFVYSNILTLVVVGSYLFFIFTMLTRTVTQKNGLVPQGLVTRCRKLFLLVGYTDGWGTRVS